MTTDVFTLSRRALEADAPTTPSTVQHPAIKTDRAASPRPRRVRSGGRLLRALFVDDRRSPDNDPLLLLGPNGGPIWTYRVR